VPRRRRRIRDGPSGAAALAAAAREARRAGDRGVGTEHLLVALVAEPGPAAEVLRGFGLDADELRHELGRRPGRRLLGVRRSRDLADVWYDAAVAVDLRGEREVEALDLLLALSGVPEAPGRELLLERGVSRGELRRRVRAVRSGPGGG
jgi:ATP-dependent Clp protease ATP-binding subunit ClpA